MWKEGVASAVRQANMPTGQLAFQVNRQFGPTETEAETDGAAPHSRNPNHLNAP